MVKAVMSAASIFGRYFCSEACKGHGDCKTKNGQEMYPATTAELGGTEHWGRVKRWARKAKKTVKRKVKHAWSRAKQKALGAFSKLKSLVTGRLSRKLKAALFRLVSRYIYKMLKRRKGDTGMDFQKEARGMCTDFFGVFNPKSSFIYLHHSKLIPEAHQAHPRSATESDLREGVGRRGGFSTTDSFTLSAGSSNRAGNSESLELGMDQGASVEKQSGYKYTIVKVARDRNLKSWKKGQYHANSVQCRIDAVYSYERCSSCCCKNKTAVKYSSVAKLVHVKGLGYKCGNVFASVEMLSGIVSSLMSKRDAIQYYTNKCVEV